MTKAFSNGPITSMNLCTKRGTAISPPFRNCQRRALGNCSKLHRLPCLLANNRFRSVADRIGISHEIDRYNDLLHDVT